MRRTIAGVVALAAAICVTGTTSAVASDHAVQQAGQVHQAGGSQRFMVRRDSSVSDAVFAEAVRAAGLNLVRSQPSLQMAVVSGPGGAEAVLRSLPGVSKVARDYSVQAQSLGFDYKTQPGSMTNVTEWTSAQAMWKAGYTGAGVGVALIDTGVAPVPSLSASDKVVVGPDLSFESQSPSTRYLDTYGHGTAMGGIIAGREVPKASGAVYATDSTHYYGMAPDARLISLKLADHNGAVDVSQMIAAIDWVVSHRSVGNIRVLNLSYGTKSGLSAQDDPLSWAAEVAWRAGIVVVASTGNDGQTSVGLASPAYNSWVLAVGAADTMNTKTAGDDKVAPFSNIGTGTTRHPDLLAPGVGIIAPADPGGYLATTYPKASLGNGFIRGSGTSQAAAVVSGAVALVLQKYPTLTPEEVKRYLMRTASTLPNLPSSMQGKGTLSLSKVLDEEPTWGYVQPLQKGNGTGSLEGARGGSHVILDGKPLTGEYDVMGQPWNSTLMAGLTERQTIWAADGTFNSAPWIGTGMTADTTSWAGRSWAGSTWAGTSWAGRSWAGSSWAGRSWAGSSWAGSSWAGSSWAGATWAGSSWADAAWSSATWG